MGARLGKFISSTVFVINNCPSCHSLNNRSYVRHHREYILIIFTNVCDETFTFTFSKNITITFIFFLPATGHIRVPSHPWYDDRY